MKKLVTVFLQLIVVSIVLLFIYTNIVWNVNSLFTAFETGADLQFNFQFDMFLLWKMGMPYAEAGYYILVTLLTIYGLMAVSVSESRHRHRLTKYDKMSYSKLLKNWQRRRGLNLVVYSTQERGSLVPGDVWNGGFIKFMQRIRNPLMKLQRLYADYRLLPATKKMNVLKLDENNEERLAAGIPLMAMRQFYFIGKYNKVWYLQGDMHSFFIGSTGRGKTFTYVLAMIYSSIMSGESMVIHDPKRELDGMMRTALKAQGYKVIVIDFVDPDKSEGWNPLDVPYQAWKEAIAEELKTWELQDNKLYIKEKFIDEHLDSSGNVIDAKTKRIVIPVGDEHLAYKYANLSSAVEQVMDISKTLTWEEDAKDPFWHNSAGDMFAGGSLFAMEEGNPDFVNAKTARYLIELGDDSDANGMPLLKRFVNKYRDVDSESVRKLTTYLNAETNVKASLKTVFTDKVSLLTSTDDIMSMTSKSTFDMRQIFKEKTAVFLKTHDEKSTYYPLVTIFLKQLYEVGIKESRLNPMQRLKIPMNWYIDEFGLLPEIKDIEAIYGAGRSRGVRINTFAQTFEQIEDKYGEKVSKIIEDNSTNVVYLGSQSTTTLNRFSEIAGEELVWDRSKKDYIARPIITKGHLNSFEKGRSMVKTIEWGPYVAKLPPYDRYAFYQKPDMSLESIIKSPAHYFNIQLEWKKRHDQTAASSAQRHKAIGAKRASLTETASGNASVEKTQVISKPVELSGP